MSSYESFRAIVADEMPLVSEGLAALCQGIAGCRVLGHATDGEQVWTMLEDLKPDVALLSLYLPKCHSLELVRRARDSRLKTQIIVITARQDRKAAIESLRAGASGVVLKTATSRELEEAMRQVRQGGVYISSGVDFDPVVTTHRRPSVDPLERLSTREHQVFTMLVDGVRAKEIAARLCLSPKTVDTYRASLMRKLDVHDVPSLVKFAIQHKITALME